MDTITGKVNRVIRHGHTMYGNPIISIEFTPVALAAGSGDWIPSDGPVTVRISDNASLVYEIDNPEFKAEAHTFALTRAGRISHVIKEA